MSEESLFLRGLEMLVTKIRNKIEMYVYSSLMNWEMNEWSGKRGLCL